MNRALSNTRILSVNNPGEANRVLLSGGVLIYPTDTCYGLGCIATHKAAVERIFKIKQRELAKTFPLLFPNLEIMRNYVIIDSQAGERLKEMWPGPLTLIFRTTDRARTLFPQCPDTLAVRISSHPFLITLFQSLSEPLVATSANRAGEPPIESAQSALQKEWINRIDLIIDGGRLSSGRASTIIDLTLPKPFIVRKGMISSDRIEKVIRGET